MSKFISEKIFLNVSVADCDCFNGPSSELEALVFRLENAVVRLEKIYEPLQLLMYATPSITTIYSNHL